MLNFSFSSRSCKKSFYLLVIWTCCCWLVFRISSHDHILNQDSHGEKNNINTRELLGKTMLGKSTPSPSGSTTESDENNNDEVAPYIDRSPKLNETDLVKKLQPQMPNLPIMYWQQNKNKKLSKNKTCAKYPDIYDLHFDNKYWQVTETSNGTFHLYGAYLDVRSSNRLGPSVRVLGMINRLEPKVKTFCQLWFNDSKEPVFSKVLEYKYIWYKKWGNYKQGLFQPYLLACQVLKHYSSLGLVDVTPISLPGYQPNLPVLQHMYLKSKLTNKRQNELIPYNDCLYRNMYRYEYIALLDIDEVIMPIEHTNWADMMKEVITTSLKVKNETRASWNFRNVYFMDEMLDLHEPEHFPDIPPYLHMMQHVYRSANYTKPGQYVKCFHNPEKALILHNHFPLGCLGGVCTSYPVDTALAHLQHYRQDCVNTLKKSCKDDFKSVSVKDTTIWRWKDPVITRTTQALNKLGFFQSNSWDGRVSSLK